MMISRSLGHFANLALLGGLCACGGGGSPAGPSTPAPTPAPTPTPNATVGPEGGTVTAFDGAVSLVIPANALPAATGITIRAASALPLDPHFVQGSGYEILPAGLTFALPARLTLRFDPANGPSGVPENDLRLHVLGTGAAWEPLPESTIPGGGTYGVRWTGPRSACGSSQDLEFDFWVGSWNYTEGAGSGATNEITKEGRGCLVEEHYRDPTGVQGRSVSLFSRSDGRWHQTYVDSRGTRIVLVGSRDGRRMVLERAGERWIWDPLDGQTIHFYAETTSDGGQTWRFIFDGRYTRQ